MQIRNLGTCTVMRLMPDEEVVSALRTWAERNAIGFATVQAIGAMKGAVLGYFDAAVSTYQHISVEEQVEVVALGGNISWSEDGEPVAHVHALLGRDDGQTLGGHLVEGTVFPTLEVILTPLPGRMQRRRDALTGLMLWDLEEWSAD